MYGIIKVFKPFDLMIFFLNCHNFSQTFYQKMTKTAAGRSVFLYEFRIMTFDKLRLLMELLDLNFIKMFGFIHFY